VVLHFSRDCIAFVLKCEAFQADQPVQEIIPHDPVKSWKMQLTVIFQKTRILTSASQTTELSLENPLVFN
jgi:hypothetical protein